MKKLIWAKTIFESYKYLSRIIKSIDRLVLERSVNSYNVSVGEITTLEKMEAVIDLIQRKKRLLVIKMLVEESLKNIDKESARILIKYYIDKIDMTTIAQNYGTNRRAMARKVNKLLQMCMEKMYDLGYNIRMIENLLENEGWIIGIYNSYVAKLPASAEIQEIALPPLRGMEKAFYNYCNRMSRGESCSA